MQPRIPLLDFQLQHEAIRAEAEAAVRRVFEGQDFILGAEVSELEQAIAQRQGCAHGIGCASGSDAILLSLVALGIGPGDAVLVPAFTFFATAGSVARAGARPVFVDIDPRTFDLDPKAVETTLRRARAHGTPKALIPVHLYGQCAEMDPLLELAEKHNLSVIEDAAQAIAARYRGRAAGSLGVAGCFSFYPTKNLGGAGDGGMVTTKDALLAERLRSLRNHGTISAGSGGSPGPGRHHHARLGINSRLDTLQAAILLVKLRHLDAWTEFRKTRAAIYRTAFLEAGLADPATFHPTQDAPVVLPYASPHAEHVYHQFTVRVERRDELASHLAEQGIETGIYYPVPLHLQPAFASLGGRAGDCPESERAAQEVLSIPLYPEITVAQQVRVVQTIEKFYRE